jgi:hypothetical protein
MRRALIVIIVALLIAVVSGISDTSLALEQQAAQASSKHDRDIAKRARKIGAARRVRIERAVGGQSEGVLEEILPDAIVVTLVEAPDRPEVIPFAEIKKIDEVHVQGQSHDARNAWILVALLGACGAAAVWAAASEPPPPAKP